ncbi:MAG: cache domain-containing protein [Desulfobacter sp.]|nr:cache domain-containing protein [Desulfobacter sp.]WDP84854.1 MAG: cache domain-containing protein [Desulfobacter sp.]
MAKHKSLVKTFWVSVTLLYLALVCLLAYLWLGWELNTRKQEFRQVRTAYIASRKQTIQTQVQQAVHYIQHKKSLAEKRVRQSVKSRTQEAWETATYIWKKNKDSLGPGQIRVLIHDALFAASWDEGKGYYFAEDMAGTELLNRNNPELEGTNLMGVQDSKGKYIMKDFIRIARSAQGEGFSTYHWNKPDKPGIFVPKISYVKYFKPLDWVIGNGKYIIDEEEKIKTEVLGYLETLKFGPKGYIFAGTFEGLSLTGPFKGKNTLDIKDANGVKIVGELIQAARSGGGFVNYVAPKFKGQPPAPKVSYVRAIDDWGWYIGTGVHIDSIEHQIAMKEAQLKKATQVLILKTFIVLGLCLLASVGLAWLLSRKISQNLELFIRYFKESAFKHRPLENDQICFSEFIPLADSASLMLKERNTYETDLAASEKKYRRLFEQSKDAFLILENGKIMDCNQASVEMLGYDSPAQPIDRFPFDLSPPVQADGQDTASKSKEMMAHAVKNGSHRFEWNHIRANGEVFPAEILLTAISANPKQQILHATWRDISDRKKTEAMMIQTEKMITVGGLAAGMAHEINNPLAGMIQSALVVKNRLSSSLPANGPAAQNAGISLTALEKYLEQRQVVNFLDTIVETGNRAGKIVQNMLNFIRKKSGEKSLQDIAGIMDQSIEFATNDYSLKKNYDIRKIKIQKQYARDVPKVLCDESNIQQVFFNIINNAAQAMAGHSYSKEQPGLDIGIVQKDQEICITIQDNGPGMDPSVSKHIFEPFYTTKPVNQGTGLGLSVSYFIIVQDHGGRIDLSSEPGKGTCFTIRLPLAPQNVL